MTPALALRHPSPDAVVDGRHHRVRKALHLNRTFPAHALGLFVFDGPGREEEIGIEPGAKRFGAPVLIHEYE